MPLKSRRLLKPAKPDSKGLKSEPQLLPIRRNPTRKDKEGNLPGKYKASILEHISKDRDELFRFLNGSDEEDNDENVSPLDLVLNRQEFAE